MAGVDGRRQSDFVAMLLELGSTAEDPALAHQINRVPRCPCAHTYRRMQVIAEIAEMKQD